MSMNFRPYMMDQSFLLPPDVRDWLPKGHLALFVSDVVDSLDLSTIFAVYGQGDGRGMPAYHPTMMVKLLVYGYCTGKTSSRKIERATYDELPYRVLSANQHPDHDSIANFRKVHLGYAVPGTCPMRDARPVGGGRAGNSASVRRCRCARNTP